MTGGGGRGVKGGLWRWLALAIVAVLTALALGLRFAAVAAGR